MREKDWAGFFRKKHTHSMPAQPQRWRRSPAAVAAPSPRHFPSNLQCASKLHGLFSRPGRYHRRLRAEDGRGQSSAPNTPIERDRGNGTAQPHVEGGNRAPVFLHFWANDDALKLANGLRAALDKTARLR